MRFQLTSLLLPVAGWAAIAGCAPASGGAGAGGATPSAARDPGPPAARRAILVSLDSFNEQRVSQTLPASAVPAIRALFAGGACAEYAVAAFPSVTAAGHAAIWTGAYGDVTGITANNVPRLPRDRHTLLEDISGFSPEALRAEPIWITAARAGMSVVAHHATQAPGPPGYPPAEGERGDELDRARRRAAEALALPAARALNGYNRTVARETVLDERSTPPRAAAGWRGVGRLGRTLPRREIAWRVGRDSVFALFHGERAYDRAVIARERDAGTGVVVHAAPVEQAPPANRPLARHFSAPLELSPPCEDGSAARRLGGSASAPPSEGAGCGRAHLVVRLFALSPDASSYLLYQPAVYAVEGNRPDVAAAYTAAVPGWIGNVGSAVLTSGRLGPTLRRGGDGTAEARWLEGAEYLTRQFMRGSEWVWREWQPRLLADYFPLGDEVDHMLYGQVDSASPRYDAASAAKVEAVRARAWALVDLRLDHLRRLVGADPRSALFVTGDHGMRTTWRVFRPNVALSNVGLLGLDTAGRIDLARTRALSPHGYFVVVNRAAWEGGTVPPAEEAAVIAAAERALTLARAPDRSPIVTRVWRASALDSLGTGGPTGGDLYFETAPGYRWSRDSRGPVAAEDSADAGHGFVPTAPDMRTVFCAAGGAYGARRIAPVRVIDIAPTVAEWLGIPAPPDARGRSVLGRLR